MDIHRCRFVQYPPQPINALTFSHNSNSKKAPPADLRLALGRNNGDIEIWNPANGLWLQETILKGRKGTTIEQLAWTQDVIADENPDATTLSAGPLRLFSIGGSTTVTEWDLSTGAQKKTIEGNFGNIWCFTPQPQLKKNKTSNNLPLDAGSQLLAAGCEDGTIILFSTEDDDIRYVRSLGPPPVDKPKVLSLAWRNRYTLVAGYEDSVIRVIDVDRRRIIRNMTLGKPAEGSSLVVWSVKCLPDGTIISGDSSGELKIWDSKNFSLAQRLNSHKADILDLATNASGDTIFSVGVDRRTVTYKQVPIHSGSQKLRWAEVSHKRYHQHDVKCGASFESKDMSVLVTGGMDTRPIVMPIRRSQTEYHRTLSHLPQRSQITASKSSRLFVSWWDQEIEIYHVPKYPAAHGSEPHYQVLARLGMQEEANIQEAQISEDGKFVIVATIDSVKLFQLRKTTTLERSSLRIRQIDLPPSLARLGARRVGFSPDGKWLFCIRKDNGVALAKIISSDEPKGPPKFHEKTVKLYRQSRNHSASELGSYGQTVTQIVFSGDSRILAVGDLSGSIDIWVLEGHEDHTFIDGPTSDDPPDTSFDSSSSSGDDEDDDTLSPVIHAQRWIRNPAGSSLSKVDSAILALTFRPSPPRNSTSLIHDNLGLHSTRLTPHPVAPEIPTSRDTALLAITATHQLVEFDVLSASLSHWSRRNPSVYLPFDFTKIKDRVVGCFWDCGTVGSERQRLWMYGSTWLFMLDLSRDFAHEDQPPRFLGEVEKIGQLGHYAVHEPVLNGNTAMQINSNQQSRSEVRSVERTRKRKRNTGAGDEIHPPDRDGFGNLVRKFKTYTGEDSEMIHIDGEDVRVGIGEDDDAMDLDMEKEGQHNDALVLMRRGEAHEKKTDPKSTDEALPTTTPASLPTDSQPPAQQELPPPTRFWPQWHTFAYRSILGIAVIGTPNSPSDPSPQETKDLSLPPVGPDQPANIEVLVVERPLHDVEQAPRFDGGQDWEV